MTRVSYRAIIVMEGCTMKMIKFKATIEVVMFIAGPDDADAGDVRSKQIEANNLAADFITSIKHYSIPGHIAVFPELVDVVAIKD